MKKVRLLFEELGFSFSEFAYVTHKKIHHSHLFTRLKIYHHIYTLKIGQYETRTADYGLGIKHGLRYKTKTTDYGLSIKHGLRFITRSAYKVMRKQTFHWV